MSRGRRRRSLLVRGAAGACLAAAAAACRSPTGEPAQPAQSAPPAPTSELAPTSEPAPPTQPAPPRAYPWHHDIVATTFWVGEVFDPSASDGSQVCSTYDARWAQHWSGATAGTVPAGSEGCAGSPNDGCDGVKTAQDECVTERREPANDFFPTTVNPKENPFYLDLPYDDLNDPGAFDRRCSVVPWADDPGYAGHCTDRSFSYLKNRWVAIVGPNTRTCYGQVQDAGPGAYDDARYVFGADDARPASSSFSNAGVDVSPALNGCLGFHELDGEDDRISWQFVDTDGVPPGPWKRLVTTSPVQNG
jgi:hypothetical protein